jgi:hypothetical protein
MIYWLCKDCLYDLNLNNNTSKIILITKEDRHRFKIEYCDSCENAFAEAFYSTEDKLLVHKYIYPSLMKL